MVDEKAALSTAIEGTHSLRGVRDLDRQSLSKLIEATKQEIALIYHHATDGDQLSRAGEELREVVQSSESQTNLILSAAEIIDQNAGVLTTNFSDTKQKALAQEIQNQIVNVYQGCNFQDLGGQRISKVLKSIEFIEAHLKRVMDLWGGEAYFPVDEAFVGKGKQSDLLNGPGLEAQDDMRSQADIDALFD